MGNLLTDAIALAGGISKLADALGVSYQAVRKWERAGRLPRTEWTGETNYSATIESLTGGRVTRERLLEMFPPGERSVA